MNIFHLSWSARYYLRHPVKFIREFFRMFKWAKQRIVRGYADRDWWDMDVWFLAVIPSMLRDFAKKGNSYPYEFETLKQWADYLNSIADKLESTTVEASNSRNKYWASYHNNILDEHEFDEKVRILYWNNYKEIQKENEENRKEAFDMMCKHFEDLWD